MDRPVEALFISTGPFGRDCAINAYSIEVTDDIYSSLHNEDSLSDASGDPVIHRKGVSDRADIENNGMTHSVTFRSVLSRARATCHGDVTMRE